MRQRGGQTLAWQGGSILQVGAECHKEAVCSHPLRYPCYRHFSPSPLLPFQGKSVEHPLAFWAGTFGFRSDCTTLGCCNQLENICSTMNVDRETLPIFAVNMKLTQLQLSTVLYVHPGAKLLTIGNYHCKFLLPKRKLLFNSWLVKIVLYKKCGRWLLSKVHHILA